MAVCSGDVGNCEPVRAPECGIWWECGSSSGGEEVDPLPHVFRDPVRPSRCSHDAGELCRAHVLARSRIAPAQSFTLSRVFVCEPGEALRFSLGWAVGVALLVADRVGQVGPGNALFAGRHGDHGRYIFRPVTRRVV